MNINIKIIIKWCRLGSLLKVLELIISRLIIKHNCVRMASLCPGVSQQKHERPPQASTDRAKTIRSSTIDSNPTLPSSINRQNWPHM